ncbi:MAG: class I SAM-dependent methyltransferase [Burkholderiaceae bacterium]|nr:class I SAM-dependent methyltransferase [Burkholderiaceae bacterium]
MDSHANQAGGTPGLVGAAQPGLAAPGSHASALRFGDLHAVPRTLLIPLAARAHGARSFPWLACDDAVAAHLLDCLGADVHALLEDKPTVLNILWRTRLIKAAGQAFFAAHPCSTGASLGCGLSHAFQWLDTGRNAWIDADLPEVMALRGPLQPPEPSRRRHACIDLTVPGWWQRLALPEGPGAAPVFLLCEGVLMYLQPAQVQAVLAEFAEHAPPGSQWVCDVISQVGVGQAHRCPSLAPTGAEFHWGVQDMADLAACHPRLRLLAQHSVAECYGWMGTVAEWCLRPWSPTPLYALVTLGV